jgi:hypothetical protein
MSEYDEIKGWLLSSEKFPWMTTIPVFRTLIISYDAEAHISMI